MVAAFLDSWMTGDPDEDAVTMEYDRPSRQEVASVVGLATRLYLGGAGTPRRYFAWGQVVRLAVLAVVLCDRAASHERPAPHAGRRVPARFTMLSVPGNPGECARPVGTPVTITSAAVSGVSSFQLRTPSGQVAPGPPSYQIMITLPAADVAAATAVVTTAYDSRGGVDFSVAGRT